MLTAALLAVFTILTTDLSAKTIKARTNGNWSATTTWQGGKVPTDKDDVEIIGFTVTLSTVASCKSLYLRDASSLTASSKLSIQPAGNLTVEGLVSLVSNQMLTTSGTEIEVLGNLNANGGIYLDNESTQIMGILTGNTVRLVVGNQANYGSINTTTLYASHVAATLGTPVPVNLITINHGDISISEDLSLGFADQAINTNYNSIRINDNAPFTGLVKRIYYSGQGLLNFFQGGISILNSNAATNYAFIFNGSSDQLLGFTNIDYHNIELDKSGGEVLVEEHVVAARAPKSIRVKSGNTLTVYKSSANLDNLSAANSIILEADGVLKLKDAGIAEGLPNPIAVTADANSSIAYEVSEQGSSFQIFREQFNYPNVLLTGAGTKYYSQGSFPIDGQSTTINSITLEAGTWKIADAVRLNLSNEKMVNLLGGSTMSLEGQFNALDANWNIDRNNTVSYISTGVQELYSFSNGATVEPYGILNLNGASSAAERLLASNTVVEIANHLSFTGTGELNLLEGSRVILRSDKDFTAYVSAIPSTYSINYATGAEFEVQKYLPLPYRAYRDLSSPIEGTTLASWKNQGVDMRGFTGSTRPTSGRVTVTRYDESQAGNLNIGFVNADNITNPIDIKSNGVYTNSVYRIQDGSNSNLDYFLTLKDKGQIKTGTQNFQVTFTATPGGGKDVRKYDDGWNNLGNPYPAALDWDLVVNDPDNFDFFKNKNVDPTVYVISQIDRFQKDPNNPGFYSFYNSETGFSMIADRIIPSYQGFWVKAYNNKEANQEFNLVIKESHKADLEESRYYKARSRKAIDPETEAVAITIFENGKAREKIWFHHWPQAKIGQDTLYDVAKFGLPSASATTIDFFSAGEPMNAWVNALPQKASSFELPIYVQCPRTGSYRLDFTNLAVFTDEFPCAYLLDQVTGKTTNLVNLNSYEFQVDAPYAGQRFLIYFNKNLGNQIAIEDAACAGAPGKFNIDLSDVEGFINLTITDKSNNSIVKRIEGANLGLQVVDLAPGNYVVRNNNGLLTCFANVLNFTIKEGAILESNFDIPNNSINQGDALSFSNKSIGAESYFWYFEDDGSFSTDENPTHVFNFPGTFNVFLTAYNSDSTCTDESQRTVTVSPTTGISEFEQAGLVLEFDEEHIIIKGLNLNEGYSAFIFTLDGKLIQEVDELKENRVVKPRNKGIYILSLVKDDSKLNSKFSIH